MWTADPNQADWLDTGKIRVTGRLMGTLAFRRTQEDFTSRITGVIAGPVRAIVRTEDRLRMILGIKSPRAIIDRIDTPYTLVMEVRIQLPFKVGWLFRDLAVRASLDLQPGESLTFTCPGHPIARIDGRTEPGETALCGSPMHGFTIAGPFCALSINTLLSPSAPSSARY